MIQGFFEGGELFFPIGEALAAVLDGLEAAIGGDVSVELRGEVGEDGRFLDVSGDSEVDGLGGGFPGGPAGEEEGGKARAVGGGAADEFDAGWAGQVEVGDEGVYRVGLEDFESGFAVGGPKAGIVLPDEQAGEAGAEGGVVIHDEQ